ncbi:MAG: hypothetical protein PSV35_04825 [bacterium]|nr:hypothetical protein [bacterium]
MAKIKIKDIAVVSQFIKNTVGADVISPLRNKFISLNATQRQSMIEGIWDEMVYLMKFAQASHLAGNKLNNSPLEIPQYITRLSTNEFFFYTQDPLTVDEFTTLQNKTAQAVSNLSADIQFVFGSYAVISADNYLLNITAHISCGKTPTFHFIIKNNNDYTDPKYRAYDEVNTQFVLLKPLNVTTIANHLPQINIAGLMPINLTFNNVVVCETSGGEKFITVIDICLDHYCGVGKANLETLLLQQPASANLQVSHLVISNSVSLQAQHCFGNVIHVDPQHSERNSKMAIYHKRTNAYLNLHIVGKLFIIYQLPTTESHSVSLAYELCIFTNKIINYFNTLAFNWDNLDLIELIDIKIRTLHQTNTIAQKQPILNELYKHLLYLEIDKTILDLMQLQCGLNDINMGLYIKKKRTLFYTASNLIEQQRIVNELKQTVSNLRDDRAYQFIRKIITELKHQSKWWKLGIAMGAKAERIEQAIIAISIEERMNLLHSVHSKLDLLNALAYRRHLLRKNEVDEQGKIFSQFKKHTFFKQPISMPTVYQVMEQENIPSATV